MGFPYRARWYEPALGRFVQPDTLVPEPGNPQDLNRYAYVRNNPLKYTDPSGRMFAMCDAESCGGYQPPPLPPGRYLRTERFGWFDKSHFHAGNPQRVIREVRRASQQMGGDVFIIPGSVQGGLHYWAHYWVSDEVTEDQVIGVALAIYMDWSRRFEAWEGRLFFGIVGRGTTFAIEDLPTHYLSFVEAATGMSLEEIFDRYLGPVEGTDAPPPRLANAPFLCIGTIGCAQKYRAYGAAIKNYDFTPRIQVNGRWINVPWPSALVITPIGSESGLWRFIGEETTWDLDEAVERLRERLWRSR